MIVTLKEILSIAERAKSAVLAPDFTTLVVARSMIEQVEELGAPLILSYSNLFREICEIPDYPTFIRIIRDEIAKSTVPICLHLDHAGSLDEIREAIDVGYTSVMIDASRETWGDNLELSRKAVELCSPHGVSVESELGRIESGEGYITDQGAGVNYTDPTISTEFVEKTGIDALAVSIGNVHGFYQGEPKIDFELLRVLDQMVDIPLVLHGTSGVGEDNIKKAVSLGIRKINLYSAIVLSMHMEMKTTLSESLFDPIGVVEAMKLGVKRVIKDYIMMLNSVGANG